jgi:putative glutamine amidotransferase
VHGGDRAAIAEIPARLTRFDGLCLPGGGDLNPARYSQAPDARSEAPDDLQDEFDLALIRTVLRYSGPPALAICRGLQVLNVACGGTLRQHVGGSTVEHLGTLHEVTLARGTRLRQLAGADTITVSSYHHQAIDRLGAGLHAIACAPDGCVEAVEHSAAGILAVQWHPEDQAATRPYDQALFDDLVARAREAAAQIADPERGWSATRCLSRRRRVLCGLLVVARLHGGLSDVRLRVLLGDPGAGPDEDGDRPFHHFERGERGEAAPPQDTAWRAGGHLDGHTRKGQPGNVRPAVRCLLAVRGRCGRLLFFW